MTFPEISQAPDITSLDQSQEMHACQRLAIPVEIRSQEKSFVGGAILTRIAIDDVLLLLTTFKDIEDPVQASCFALLYNVGTNTAFVDLRGLGDRTDALRRVLFDMLLGARMDQIEFEIWGCIVLALIVDGS